MFLTENVIIWEDREHAVLFGCCLSEEWLNDTRYCYRVDMSGLVCEVSPVERAYTDAMYSPQRPKSYHRQRVSHDATIERHGAIKPWAFLSFPGEGSDWTSGIGRMGAHTEL